MAYQDKIFDKAENVGFVDSVIRASVAVAIVVTVMLVPEITSVTLFALTQVAIYAGLTAFIGWDPVYAIMKQTAGQLPAQSSATTPASYPKQQSPATGDDHKKAA